MKQDLEIFVRSSELPAKYAASLLNMRQLFDWVERAEADEKRLQHEDDQVLHRVRKGDLLLELRFPQLVTQKKKTPRRGVGASRKNKNARCSAPERRISASPKKGTRL